MMKFVFLRALTPLISHVHKKGFYLLCYFLFFVNTANGTECEISKGAIASYLMVKVEINKKRGYPIYIKKGMPIFITAGGKQTDLFSQNMDEHVLDANRGNFCLSGSTLLRCVINTSAFNEVMPRYGLKLDLEWSLFKDTHYKVTGIIEENNEKIYKISFFAPYTKEEFLIFSPYRGLILKSVDLRMHDSAYDYEYDSAYDYVLISNFGVMSDCFDSFIKKNREVEDLIPEMKFSEPLSYFENAAAIEKTQSKKAIPTAIYMAVSGPEKNRLMRMDATGRYSFSDNFDDNKENRFANNYALFCPRDTLLRCVDAQKVFGFSMPRMPLKTGQQWKYKKQNFKVTEEVVNRELAANSYPRLWSINKGQFWYSEEKGLVAYTLNNSVYALISEYGLLSDKFENEYSEAAIQSGHAMLKRNVQFLKIKDKN